MFLAPSIKVQPCSEEDFLKVLFNNFSLACWFRLRLLEHYPLALLEGEKSKGKPGEHYTKTTEEVNLVEQERMEYGNNIT